MKEVSYAQFHTPVFFNSKNWGLKIEPFHRSMLGKIRVFHDGQEIVLKAGDKEQKIPMSNVAAYEFHVMAKAVEVPIPQVERAKPGPKPKISAQVSGPTHHVFAEGPGKTRD